MEAGKLLKYPGRKLLKHVSLWGETKLRAHLPETELFSADTFIQMIERHPVVFLKPDLGMRGQGIMKVSREGNDCIVRMESNIYKYRDPKSAVQKLTQLIGNERYIVQQGIDLIKIDGKPVDFRVLLHIMPNKKWRFFGIMGKVAAQNQIVTNHSAGGKAIRLYQALSQTFGITKQEGLQWDKRIKDLSLDIADAMKWHFPNITELGLDVAVDTDKKIWLLEANTKPQYQLFRHHSNPLLYSQIANSARALRK